MPTAGKMSRSGKGSATIRVIGLKIGASIGVVPVAKEDRDAVSLMSRADAAAYKAKRAGRNAVCVALGTNADANREQSVR